MSGSIYVTAFKTLTQLKGKSMPTRVGGAILNPGDTPSITIDGVTFNPLNEAEWDYQHIGGAAYMRRAGLMADLLAA